MGAAERSQLDQVAAMWRNYLEEQHINTQDPTVRAAAVATLEFVHNMVLITGSDQDKTYYYVRGLRSALEGA